MVFYKQSTVWLTCQQLMLWFCMSVLIAGCDPRAMAPNPNLDIRAQDVQATVERHPSTGAYTLRWVASTKEQSALILATTNASDELTGADTIAVGALSPFTWIPEEQSEKYFFTVLVTGAPGVQVVDWVSPAPDGPLEGRWYKSCGLIHAEYEHIGYDTIDLTITSAAYHFEARFFSDANCTVPIPGEPARVFKGQIHIGEPLRTIDGKTATTLNVYGSGNRYTDLPRFTIFKIDGDVLRFGKKGNEVDLLDGMTETERSIELDTKRIFNRKTSAQLSRLLHDR